MVVLGFGEVGVTAKPVGSDNKSGNRDAADHCAWECAHDITSGAVLWLLADYLIYGANVKRHTGLIEKKQDKFWETGRIRQKF
jgi:hypothetical protein